MFAVIHEGWSYVARTPLIRGLVVGITGAFAAGGVVIGLARVYVADLGGGDPGYGVLFAAVFTGLALGMWRGPRLLAAMSRRRLFGFALICGRRRARRRRADRQPGRRHVPHGRCSASSPAPPGSRATRCSASRSRTPLRGRTFAFVQTLIRLVLAAGAGRGAAHRRPDRHAPLGDQRRRGPRLQRRRDHHVRVGPGDDRCRRTVLPSDERPAGHHDPQRAEEVLDG